jgi:hypothetical protein
LALGRLRRTIRAIYEPTHVIRFAPCQIIFSSAEHVQQRHSTHISQMRR